MKKLMIAAAIVCATVAAQAATYDWTFSSDDTIRNGWTAAEGQRVGSSSLAGAGLKAYLIAYTADTMDQNTILTGLREGKTIDKIAGSAKLAESATIADSTIGKFSWDDEVGDPITAFAVIINNDGSYVYVNEQVTGAAAEHPLSADFKVAGALTRNNRDAAGTKSWSTGNDGWYAVPEPTSGLLLLLGVGALALRRRRA